jgi:hypothetical protein
MNMNEYFHDMGSKILTDQHMSNDNDITGLDDKNTNNNMHITGVE